MTTTSHIETQTIGTEDAAILVALIDSSTEIVTTFLVDIVAMRGSERIFAAPALFFTEDDITLEDMHDLREPAKDHRVRECVNFPELVGLSGDHIAKIVGRGESTVYRVLLVMAVAVGAIDKLGAHPDRHQLFAEKGRELSAVLNELMLLEV